MTSMPSMTKMMSLFAASAALAVGGAAVGEECACDCYFSSDCESGNFCNWGNLSIEDSCFWRRPKPQGVPGANCGDNYGDWGQCDGICTPTAAPGQAFAKETQENITAGIELWSQGMLTAGVNGGGAPANELVTRIHAMPFTDLNITYGLWRFTGEMMILAAGRDALVYPRADFEHPEVRIKALTPAEARNFEIVTKVLLAEINELGSGFEFIDEIDVEALDGPMFDAICRANDPLECLYVRVQDIGEFIGGAQERQGGPLPAGGGPQCSGCIGDVDYNDAVSFGDVLMILAAWGSNNQQADVNNNGVVDFGDLITTLASWGPCAPN